MDQSIRIIRKGNYINDDNIIMTVNDLITRKMDDKSTFAFQHISCIWYGICG